MKQRAIAFVACVLCIGAWASAGVGVGDKPTLSFNAAGTKEAVSLSDYKGKIVVIDFWATWCGPCMGEAAHMVAVNDKYSSQGMVLIGISLDTDVNHMQEIAAAKGFTWVQCCDGQSWQGSIVQQFGVDGIPHTVLVGPDGTVLWTGHPAGGLDQALEAAFRDHPPVLVDPATAAAAAATADMDAVDKALDANDFSSAVKAWGKVPDGIDKDKKLAARQVQVQERLNAAGEKALADVEIMVQQKQYRPAIAALRDMVSKMGALPAGAKAHERLMALASDPEVHKQLDAADRADRAAGALAIAEQYKAQKKDELAYARLKAVTTDFSGTPAAATAADELAAYDKEQPGLAQQVAGSANDAKAKAAFNLAEAYHGAGNDDLAKRKYQEVIDKYPGTSWADAARKKLAQMS